MLLVSSAAAQAVPRISAQVSASQVSASKMVTIQGNRLPLADAMHDMGRVADGTPTGRLILSLQHSPQQHAALETLIAAQQDPTSPSFHKFLTTAQYASQFGVADSDIQTVTDYLSSQGFTVSQVFPNKMAIEFSGTAGQLRSAFKTEIHSFNVNGQKFLANDRDPQIPAALAPVVRGFASLNNYQQPSKAPAALKIAGGVKSVKPSGGPQPLYTTVDPTNGNTYNLSPGDIAEIYNIPSTSTGTGVSIGVVNTSNVNLVYVTNYQTTFGLKVKDPTVVVDGDDPGETSNEIDGVEQLELLSAVAPNATLYYYTSASSSTEDGLTIGVNFAMIRAVDDDLVQVLLYDYESCEANLGAVGTAFVNEVDEQAAAEGISVIAASGNGGSDSCESQTGYGNSSYVALATTGLSVNGYATTPFVTAVGATDFYYGTNATIASAASYWNQSNGDSSYTSALSYIPEQPWDLSYDGPSNAQTNIYGTDPAVVASGGGVSTLGDSNDDTSAPGPYPTPSWQIPVLPASLASTGARVVPDVAIFGGNGQNGSSYILCAAADECLNGTPGTLVYEIAGGTSEASATFAGIAALVVQSHGAQGNLNPTLYSLFQSANASLIFHAMQAGTNAVDCSSGSTDCGSGGYLVSGGTAAYPATAGYNAASGLGSVNVANLIADWKTPFTKVTKTTFSLTSPGTSTPLTTFVHGTTVQANIAVTGNGGTPAGDVAIITTTPLPNNKVPVSYTLTNGKVTDTTLLDGLAGGTYNIEARYAGGGSYEASLSTPITVTITPESSTIDLINESFTPGSTVSYGTSISVGVSVFSATNSNSIGLPTGSVTVLDNGTQLTSIPLDDTGLATFTAQLAAGSHSLTFSYPGDASYDSSSTSSGLAVNVSAESTSTSLTSSSSNDPGGSYVQLIAIVNSTAGATQGIPPAGTITFNALGKNAKTLATVTLVPGTNSSGVLAGIANYRLPGSYLTGNKDTAVQAVFTPASGSSYAASMSSSLPLTTTKTGGTTLSKITLKTSDGAATYFDYATGITFDLTIASNSKTVTTTPTGTVSLYDNGAFIGTATLSGGTATVSILQNQNTGYLLAPITIGTNIITAQYSGDSTFGGSASSLNITVLDEASLPDFSIQSNVTYGTLTSSSSSASFTLLFTSLNNFAGLGKTITLSTTSSPGGISCTFGSSPVNFGGASYVTDTATCSESKTLAAGTYTVLVKAVSTIATKPQTNTSSTQVHTIPLQVVVE